MSPLLPSPFLDVRTLKSQPCINNFCLYSCVNETSDISPDAPSPLIVEPFTCVVDPPQCINLKGFLPVPPLSPCTLSNICSTQSTITPSQTGSGASMLLTGSPPPATTPGVSGHSMGTLHLPTTHVHLASATSSNTSPSASTGGIFTHQTKGILHPAHSSPALSSTAISPTPPVPGSLSAGPPVFIWGIVAGVSAVGVVTILAVGGSITGLCCYMKKYR